MQAIAQARRVPSARRRAVCGAVALVAFGLFLVLNFWPGWEALPFLTDRMTYTLGAVDFALWAVIASHVAYMFSDAPGVHLFAHLVTAVLAMFAFTRLMRDFPFALSSGLWSGVVHWVLVLGTVVAFLVIPVTWWQMVGVGYIGPKRRKR